MGLITVTDTIMVSVVSPKYPSTYPRNLCMYTDVEELSKMNFYVHVDD